MNPSILNKKTILIVVSICLLNICKGQTNNNEIDQLVSDIEQDNIFRSYWYHGGFETSYRYNKLIENASPDKLVELTEHRNAVVRCYSFQALLTHKEFEIRPILIMHLYDTSIINWSWDRYINKNYDLDTILEKRLTGDLFLILASEYLENHKNLKAEIDSILIFDKRIILKRKSYILQKLEPDVTYENRIREMVKEGNDSFGLIALARFKNQHDKNSIIRNLKSKDSRIQFYGLWAAKNFPDSSFFPFIKLIHKTQLSYVTPPNEALLRMLYQVIVQYKDEPSCKLIELTLITDYNNSEKESLNKAYIWLALKIYPNPIYKSYFDAVKGFDEYGMKHFEEFIFQPAN